MKLNFMLSILVLSGCGVINKKSDKNDDLVTYDIEVKVSDASKLSDDKAQLLAKLNNKEAISFSLITDLIVQDQVNYYNTISKEKNREKISVNELNSFVDKLTEAQSDVDDPHQIKIKYEDQMTKINGSASLYNSVATTLGHIAKENQQQCYSGTILNQVIWRKNKNFRSQHPVVIHEDGHILPGYMRKVDGKWHLFGIETTATGRAEITYGATDAIRKPVRVVDAELFALIELYKDYLEHPNTVANNVLNITARKYDLKLADVSSIGERGTSLTGKKPNSSPFGFGSAKEEDRPIERQKIDKVGAGTPRGERAWSEVCTGKGRWFGIPESDFCIDRTTGLAFSAPFSIPLKEIFESRDILSDALDQHMTTTCTYKFETTIFPYWGRDSPAGTILSLATSFSYTESYALNTAIAQSISGNYSFESDSSNGGHGVQSIAIALKTKGNDGLLNNVRGVGGKNLYLGSNSYISTNNSVKTASSISELPSSMVGVCVMPKRW